MNTFWMDMRKFETDKDRITGAELKTFANCSPSNPVFQDVFGKGPNSDVGVGDGEAVSLLGEVKHFYTLIPATNMRGNP